MTVDALGLEPSGHENLNIVHDYPRSDLLNRHIHPPEKMAQACHVVFDRVA
jgi:hypothetical protein